MGIAIFLVIAATWLWVGYDAKQRDWSYKKHGAKTAAGQIIGVVILWIVFFPVYLVQRRIAETQAAALPTAGAPAEQFKRCPDCAETVLADARVCKHCHYRFDQAIPTT